MSEEQLLFWKKAMFPEIAEKDKEIERLNNRINKAIEYIELGINFDSLGVTRTKRKLLKILKGEDNE